MLNRVTLAGNLTRDPEAVTGGRSPMTRLRVATNTAWRDADGNRQERSEYHSVLCFGRVAETCAEYCGRGRAVFVEGRLRTREYTGSDGVRRFATDVVADAVHFLDRRDTVASVPAGGDEDAEPHDDAAAAGDELRAVGV